MKRQKGITLIALVITIIVLLILAGVSISMALGENGILTRAEGAVDKYKEAERNELAELQEAEDLMDEYITGGTNNPEEPVTPTESEIETYRKAGTYMDEETTLEDDDGNNIVVPKGFKIAEDSGTSVTEGIVIEDNDIKEGIGQGRGNQYVWIPVGEEIKKSDGTTVDITLGRYLFANGTTDMSEDGVTPLAKGTPILKQSAENYEDEIIINTYYQELVESRTGVASNGLDGLNTTALNLAGFIESVKENGGYYIARYEASYGADGKANSKVSDSFATTAPTTEGQLWNNITQIDAATASRNLYTEVTSDLMNSYAWDTAIVYIQEFSEKSDYSRETALYIGSLRNTGNLAESIKDEVCKINDMASNTREWTTEYSNYTDSYDIPYAAPCVIRGGFWNNSSHYTSYRLYISATFGTSAVSFRSALYM